MVHTSKLLSLLSLAVLCTAQSSQYTLQDQFTKANFFTEFGFFTDPDPTGNITTYVGAAVANQQRLAGFVEDQIYLGINYDEVNAGDSRESTRLASNSVYNGGLFVADIAHMPEGCGTWPALWSFGPGWPKSGEIDVLENVNSATTDRVTLHTGPHCDVTTAGSAATTTLLGSDCNAGNGTQGCSANTTAPFGAALNKAGGAVWAWEWRTDGISVWGFDNGSPQAAAIRASAGNKTAPDMSSWGTPVAAFSSGPDGGCDFPAQFQNHQITINTEICGDWAGQGPVWSSDPVCGPLAATCDEYLANTPDALVDAYWLINSISVFTKSGGSSKRRLNFRG